MEGFQGNQPAQFSIFCAFQVTLQMQPARLYVEDTFVYYIKTLFHTYIPDTALAAAPVQGRASREPGSRCAPALPEQVLYL